MLTTRLLSKYLATRRASQSAELRRPEERSEDSALLGSEVLSVQRSAAKNAVKEAENRPKLNGDAPRATRDGFEDVDAGMGFEPLTHEQAQAVLVRLRKTASLLSPWLLIMWQVLVGAVVTAVALLVSGEKRIALSAAYGAVAVVLPAGMFAWGVMRRRAAQPALMAGLRFVVWEVAKVVLTVAMLFAAPALVANMSWLALLAGFVATMKVYWLAVWLYPVRNKSI